MAREEVTVIQTAQPQPWVLAQNPLDMAEYEATRAENIGEHEAALFMGLFRFVSEAEQLEGESRDERIQLAANRIATMLRDQFEAGIQAEKILAARQSRARDASEMSRAANAKYVMASR